MKKCLLAISLLGIAPSIFACPLCNKMVRESIYNSHFFPNLLMMLSAFIVLALIVSILTLIANNWYSKRLNNKLNIHLLNPIPLTMTSLIIGIGLGGLIDGTILHQILQIHEMLSNKIPSTNYIGKSVNMFWDGIFHLFCVIIILLGLVLMWKLLSRKDINHSRRLLAGGLLLGWGLFNMVEGIINHHILELHNVVEFSIIHQKGNFVFLVISAVLIIIGYILVKKQLKWVREYSN